MKKRCLNSEQEKILYLSLKRKERMNLLNRLVRLTLVNTMLVCENSRKVANLAVWQWVPCLGIPRLFAYMEDCIFNQKAMDERLMSMFCIGLSLTGLHFVLSPSCSLPRWKPPIPPKTSTATISWDILSGHVHFLWHCDRRMMPLPPKMSAS